MKKDKILETIPELNYIRRWTKAIEKKRYEDALAILNEGLEFAKRRGSSLFTKHFHDLQRETMARSSEISNRGLKKAGTYKRREVRITCSFCGKKRAEVSQMVAGARAYICDRCIKLCYEITRGDQKSKR